MKRQLLAVAAALLALGVLAVPAGAAIIVLDEYAFNIDGTVSNPVANGDPVPLQVDLSLFDTGTGLGRIRATIAGTGSHFFGVFVDHDIDEGINTFFNEYGAAYGTPALGHSWEIDEPGWTFGDIYDNFAASALDNLNGVPQGFEDDVSMALGWNFDLSGGQYAMIDMLLSTTPPTGFYLQQTDPDSQVDVYFSSTLRASNVIPEPASALIWLLLPAAGVAGRWWKRRRA